jgi:hypothetical protein
MAQRAITPEMIEAARSLLWDEQVSPWEDRDELLVKIYQAMESARCQADSGECSARNEQAHRKS